MTTTASSDNRDLYHVRVPYNEAPFTEDQLASRTDPFVQFNDWLDKAMKCDGIQEANAVCLGTCSKDGRPSSRMLLMKSFSKDGFKFFSNYETSRKSRDLAGNPFASMLFYWPPLHRQVRIEGVVKKLSSDESAEYFKARPLGSQISATISKQSTVISSRQEVMEKHQTLEAECQEGGKELSRPKHWGGFVLVPSYFEFWQGQSNRLHDRITFSLRDSDTWELKRLSP